MILPKLYHKAKTGKIQVCQIWTEYNKIYTQFGIQDGKMQTAEQICHPKNVGKKNETTGEQQAESEARSKWQKKKDKKYVEDLAAVEVVRISPMLAKKYTDKRVKWPATVQKKLNGLRCMGRWVDGRVVLQSRGNKFYTVAHIQQQLEKCLPKDLVFDGEIYIHGVSLQKINSLVKKPKPGSEKLEYWVYDCCKEEPSGDGFQQRFWNVYERVCVRGAFNDDIDKIRYVDSPHAANKEEMLELHAEHMQEGYEGTIIRNLDGIYRFGFRSDDLLKYKDFEDAEYLVVGLTEGTGKFTGTPIWICETEGGKRFNVTPTGSLENRKDTFLHAEGYIGKRLTVRFIGKTESDIPCFGVGVAWRIDEDLPVA